MSILYRSIGRKNPADPDAPEKYYVILVKQGETNLNELADLMGKGATMRRADVYAVLEGLIEELCLELSKGRSVKLGEFGSFTLAVNSEGVITEDEVTPSLIKRVKIVYRPGRKLRRMLATLMFKKAND